MIKPDYVEMSREARNNYTGKQNQRSYYAQSNTLSFKFETSGLKNHPEKANHDE